MTDCAQRLSDLTHERDVILDEDVAALRKMTERSRIERYNQLKESEEEFRWEFTKECGDFLTDAETGRVRGEFRLARLLLAASLYDEGDLPPAMAGDFVEAELQAVLDFERYKRFDALSEDQIEEKIRRMEGEVYELVTEYTSTQIANMDELMDDPDVQQDVIERLLARYERRREKIRQGFFVYVETHGLEHMVEAIEEAVEAVADAADERRAVRDELEAQLESIADRIDQGLDEQRRQLEAELDAVASQAAADGDASDIEARLEKLDERTAEIHEMQEATLSELDHRIERTVELEARLEAKIDRLEEARAEAAAADREAAREEATDLIETELSNLQDERAQLREEIEQLKREREGLETARERLDERQESLEERVESVETSVESAGGLEGEDVVTAAIARLLELDYLGRFDISMQEAERIETGDHHFEVPDGYWDGRSERRSERMRLVDLLDEGADFERYPTNRSARYEITSSRYLGLSRETEMVIEAQVCSHLEAYAANDFDASPADVDDLLALINDAVHEAERAEATHLLGVASPTGWTDQVIAQIREAEFARTRYSRYVSIVLVDLQSGEVLFDESDPVAAENAHLFEPPVDSERVAACVETLRSEYVEDVGHETVLLDDVVSEHGFDPHVTKRAFNRLEHEGSGEQLFVDDLGLTLDVSNR